MAEGNGTDLATIVAMLSQVLVDQQAFRAEVRTELAALKQDVAALKRDVASLKTDLAALNSKVEFYHSAVMGHGIMLTELDQRLRRVEHHLGLPPMSTH